MGRKCGWPWARVFAYLGAAWADGKALGRYALEEAIDRPKAWLARLLLSLGAALALWPCEMSLLRAIQEPRSETLVHLARHISQWGDWYPGTLLVCGSLALIGLGYRPPVFRRAAIACLMAASLAGLVADVFKFGLGRARPNSGLIDGCYGPRLGSRYHGFPSGHTASAFGTAVSVSRLFPEAALPAVALAASVGWSRMYLNYHRPTDVLVGAALGTGFGWIFGAAARKRRVETEPPLMVPDGRADLRLEPEEADGVRCFEGRADVEMAEDSVGRSP